MLGEPIPEMVNKIKQLLSEGVPVVIFTARVNPSDANPDDARSATQSYLAIPAPRSTATQPQARDVGKTEAEGKRKKKMTLGQRIGEKEY